MRRPKRRWALYLPSFGSIGAQSFLPDITQSWSRVVSAIQVTRNHPATQRAITSTTNGHGFLTASVRASPGPAGRGAAAGGVGADGSSSGTREGYVNEGRRATGGVAPGHRRSTAR